MRNQYLKLVLFELLGLSLFFVISTFNSPWSEFMARAPVPSNTVIGVLVVASLLFVVQALFFRNSFIKSRKWARSVDVLFSDFGFDSYVTVNFMSFVFALAQAFVFSSYCTVLVFICTYIRYWPAVQDGAESYIGGLLSIPVLALIFLFILLLIRFSLEAYVLVYKASLALQSIASKENGQENQQNEI